MAHTLLQYIRYGKAQLCNKVISVSFSCNPFTLDRIPIHFIHFITPKNFVWVVCSISWLSILIDTLCFGLFLFENII